MILLLLAVELDSCAAGEPASLARDNLVVREYDGRYSLPESPPSERD